MSKTYNASVVKRAPKPRSPKLFGLITRNDSLVAVPQSSGGGGGSLDGLFTLVEANGVQMIRANYGLYSNDGIVAGGMLTDVDRVSLFALADIYGDSVAGKVKRADGTAAQSGDAIVYNTTLGKWVAGEVQGGGGGGAAVWGQITGTLSNQTDLMTALAGKLSDAPTDGGQYLRKNGAWDPVTVPTSLSQLSDDGSHRLVTDTEKNTWNGKYSKPSTGIPATDLASAVQASLGKADTAYQKPSGGVPKTDLASAVQTSLGKADSAYQKPSGGIPKSDLASAVQTSLGKADTAVQPSTLNNYTLLSTFNAFKSVFDEMFELDTTDSTHLIKAKLGLWTEHQLVAGGRGSGQGGGSDVVWDQTLLSGTPIATIKIGEASPITVFAPNPGDSVSWGASTADTQKLTVDGVEHTLLTAHQSLAGYQPLIDQSHKLDYGLLSNTPTIPSEVTESTVSGWGFTKNVGTITGITMNGESKGTSGVVDLGTVLTQHQSLSNYYTKTETDTLLAGYLPKTGGTISGSLNVTGDAEVQGNSYFGQQMFCKHGTYNAELYFVDVDGQGREVRNAKVGYDKQGGAVYLENLRASCQFAILADGTPIYRNNGIPYTLYHANNANKTDVAWSASQLTLPSSASIGVSSGDINLTTASGKTAKLNGNELALKSSVDALRDLLNSMFELDTTSETGKTLIKAKQDGFYALGSVSAGGWQSGSGGGSAVAWSQILASGTKIATITIEGVTTDVYAPNGGASTWNEISGKPTTISGYGITDAKIQNGTITLGANTITPLTQHQSLANYYTKSEVDTALAGKQATISDLSTIRSNASNGQTAYGWGNHANAGYQKTSNLVTAWESTTLDSKYPSEKLVKTSLNAKQDTISDLSTIRSGASLGATALQPSALNPYRTASAQDTIDSGKVDKVTGKGLSTNDYTDTEKSHATNGQTAYGWGNHATAGYQKTNNLITSWNSTASDSKYPSEKLVKTALGGKQDTISDLSTIRSGAGLGATAVQPATLNSALSGYIPLTGSNAITGSLSTTDWVSAGTLYSRGGLIVDGYTYLGNQTFMRKGDYNAEIYFTHNEIIDGVDTEIRDAKIGYDVSTSKYYLENMRSYGQLAILNDGTAAYSFYGINYPLYHTDNANKTSIDWACKDLSVGNSITLSNNGHSVSIVLDADGNLKVNGNLVATGQISAGL